MLMLQIKKEGQRQLGADWDTTTAVSVGIIAVFSIALFVALVVSRVRHNSARGRGRGRGQRGRSRRGRSSAGRNVS